MNYYFSGKAQESWLIGTYGRLIFKGTGCSVLECSVYTPLSKQTKITRANNTLIIFPNAVPQNSQINNVQIKINDNNNNKTPHLIQSRLIKHTKLGGI